jgi:hypothetical protein
LLTVTDTLGERKTMWAAIPILAIVVAQVPNPLPHQSPTRGVSSVGEALSSARRRRPPASDFARSTARSHRALVKMSSRPRSRYRPPNRRHRRTRRDKRQHSGKPGFATNEDWARYRHRMCLHRASQRVAEWRTRTSFEGLCFHFELLAAGEGSMNGVILFIVSFLGLR